MNVGDVITIGQDALWTAVLIASPLLGTALLLGVVIGVLQAATSIQEMTLSFIPKLAGMVLALALFGAWQISTIIRFFEYIVEYIPTVLL